MPSLDGLVWFRRDLRLDDNAALSEALSSCDRVWCAFAFDRDILDALPSRADRRVEFIRASLVELDAGLRALGGGLVVVHDRAADAIPRLAAALGVDAVFAARDYEPDAVRRDATVAGALREAGRELRLVKDQAVFDTDEVLTGAGRPFSVFTPYRNAWTKRLDALGAYGAPGTPLAPHPVRDLAPGRLAAPAGLPAAGARGDAPLGPAPVDGVPSLAAIGFEPTDLARLPIPTGSSGGARLFEDFLDRIDRYREARDFPALKGPSYLSVHLRFGTVSVRTLAREAVRVARTEPDGADGASAWLSELVWRDFYFQVLHHHPRVVTHAFRPEYDAIRWEGGARADALFEAWRDGRTGYPLVDAAMIQLKSTGWMHNRLRMVTASFLCKDLGVDWRRGERWFADALNDYDLSANNGGWQWAASTGCDAQPWFRIFNPVTQSERFDAKGAFVRRYLPRLEAFDDRRIHAPWLVPDAEQRRLGCVIGRDYPAPVVDHAEARARTLERYAAVRGAAGAASALED
ncbi:MAG TPA: deoxyribodipyrimidine photo-lyase [Burkholderiaceae bacterium]|nr:deoxyribodipyrimidine photo-lyase [Burkholderiaceae bacterium]